MLSSLLFHDLSDASITVMKKGTGIIRREGLLCNKIAQELL